MPKVGSISFKTCLHIPLSALVASLTALAVTASANSDAEAVRGFLCNSKADQIAFLGQQAQGENEEMAANAVNKSVAQASCAYYLPLKAVPGEEQTIFSGGLAFKVQKFIFLPEKSEHWAGSVIGAIPVSAKENDI